MAQGSCSPQASVTHVPRLSAAQPHSTVDQLENRRRWRGRISFVAECRTLSGQEGSNFQFDHKYYFSKDMAATTTDGSSTASHTSQTFNLGGMFEPFAPPPACLGNTYTLAPNGYDETTTTSYAGRSATSTIASRGLDPTCFFNVTAIPISLTPTAAVLHYSPGTCFIGYTAVALSVSEGFTTATCCPSYVCLARLESTTDKTQIEDSSLDPARRSAGLD